MTFYDGYIDVSADDEDQAVTRALRQLKKGSFSDRSNADWNIYRIENRTAKDGAGEHNAETAD